ncbi:tetratricopeptide repeat protein [Pelagicoccus sp. SDUM812002]|uniref:tetratricopeptide repeat protein n=1 Tax=Pelagicoccus sp. SDUM812002 TaxID=3041266 RepID=UPI00280F9842|nr:tetratricopeptide repeat protein [Pelagicoccus sp. SDUM812002]MDQ8188041.1 tetratricopeptide repeat protein [Pelagicoccus sp. SDUM812002]
MPDSDESSLSPPSTRSSFFAELRRRKVFRVAAAYVVVAWIIIQVAAATFPGFEIPMWAFRFVVLMLILGFPVALILAWAFELTPDGIKLTKNVSEEQKAVTSQGKRNWLSYGFAAALPAVIFGSLALYFYFTREASTAPHLDKSIAVLPFENRSASEDDAYFTDGIHDDLLTQISRIREIKTISRTSVMAYRDTSKNMREIGAELGVATILEGGVQRAGDQIRINVQLIDAATDAHLWAETYTREMTVGNIFAIQSEIATAIAGELKAVLSPEEQQQLQKLPTQNLAALQLAFKASAVEQTAEGAREAIKYLKQAIELDPDFALAHGSLSGAYLYQIWSEGLPVDEQLIKAEPHIRRALELDPTDSHIQVAWASYNIRKGDNAAAQAALERAIELNPNDAQAYALGAWFQLWTMRNPAASVELGRKAVELDPVSSQPKQGLAEALMVAGDFDESEELLRELMIEEPRNFDFFRTFGNLQREAFNLYDEAIEAYRKALSLDPENQYVSMHLASAYQALGDRDQTAFWWNYALEQAPDSGNATYVRGMLHLVEDEDEAALATLREVEEGNPYFSAALSNIVSTELRLGRPGKALEYLLEKRPALNEPGMELSQDNMVLAAQLARAQLQSNQQTQATALVDRIAATAPKLVRMGTFGFLANDADLYAAAGDYDRALAALRELIVDAGGCSSEFAKGSEWDPLRDDPEFQELMAINDVRLQEQRANLARMEANGELAPIPEL